MGSRQDRTGYVLAALVAFFGGALLWEFRAYSADDSFIYLRYVVNWIEHGELVFNLGERVTTLTSPLVTLLVGGLHAAFGEARSAFKVLSVVMLAASVVMLWRATPVREVRPAAAAVLLTAPAVAYWTVGGMEVAPLTLLITAVSALAIHERWRAPVLVTFLGGLAFLARFDTAPFMTVIVISVLWQESWGTRLKAVLIGAALPVAWLAFSQIYFDDIFPTSFYVKSPRLEMHVLRSNGLYLLQGLLLTGALPLLVTVLAARLFNRRRVVTESDVLGRRLLVAVLVQLAYAATMATVHMMFGFRALLPYLPAIILLAGRIAEPLRLLERRRALRLAFTFLVLLLGSFQALQARWTQEVSVQGFATLGELRQTSLDDMTHAIDAAAELPLLVREHWESLDPPRGRPPRIACGMEGVIPYSYPDAYFFGLLVSYRTQLAAEFDWADYVILPFPEGSAVPLREVAAVEYDFEGIGWRFVAMFNAKARFDMKLPSTVAGPDPN